MIPDKNVANSPGPKPPNQALMMTINNEKRKGTSLCNVTNRVILIMKKNSYQY